MTEYTKLFLSIAVIVLNLLTVSAVFALDASMIKLVHSTTKRVVIEKCKKDFPQLSNAACECLADESDNNLDDSVLANCPNGKAGGDCIKHAVEQAMLQALINVNVCTSRHPK